MIKEILSIIEGVLAGIISYKVAVPFFLSLAKTEVGGWAYLGLFSFLIAVMVLEIASYYKNKTTWFVAIVLGFFY